MNTHDQSPALRRFQRLCDSAALDEYLRGYVDALYPVLYRLDEPQLNVACEKIERRLGRCTTADALDEFDAYVLDAVHGHQGSPAAVLAAVRRSLPVHVGRDLVRLGETAAHERIEECLFRLRSQGHVSLETVGDGFAWIPTAKEVG